ncbi:hypothetical protein HK107_11525 [Parvularcula sp. ZS-1/3]|uniref:CENP-V/GFA domain-containing protein n=1 Tax=Parvularcula mediterranea TaxID=2732508 RepID=A0A7Y3RMS6_9PROT|nr:DUF6151 family protein [Parvularcula mediterranea]NNU16949.1 hypothetical protein [Parvularcula mediterranea]
MSELTYSCSCGQVTGTLSEAAPDKGTRVCCYCTDCQAFEEFLGKSDEVLNEKGGADIYQTLPHRMSFLTGTEHLKAVRMTDGRLVRWYAGCCNTPIGSTADTPDMPIIGFLAHPFLRANGELADHAFGQTRGALFGKEAWSPPEGKKASLPGMVLTFMARVIGARLSGKTGPNPFFDEAKQPLAEPRLISPEERAEIDARLKARHAA